MIFFDIETIPNTQAIQRKEWADYKSRKNIQEDRDAGLHPAFGQVCCICAVSDNPQIAPFFQAIESEDKEISLLADFRKWLHSTRDGWLCGYNIKGFDIPFLANRYLAHGSMVPQQLTVAGKKPWEIQALDLMEILQHGGGPKLSLGDVCVLMGIPSPKEDFSGKLVWSLYQKSQPISQEDRSNLLVYCQQDVFACQEILNRLRESEALV